MKNRITLWLMLFLIAIRATAQINTPTPTIPFGTNTKYAGGILPSNRNVSDAQSAYNTWKSNYVRTCGSQSRVLFDDGNSTVSEGIGYGMLLAAYAGDKALFDGLWAYYKANSNGGLMDWKIGGCSGVTGSGAATDADEDAAWALIVAEYQWPNINSPYDYNSEANTLITNIGNKEIASNQADNGAGWGTSNTCRNPSYQAPAYYRQFASQVSSQSGLWNGVVTGSYNLLNANVNSGTGLVSNWSDNNGNHNSCNGPDEYGYDACRNPWRMAMDVIWNNTSSTQTNFCNKIAAYCQSHGATSVGGNVPQSGGTGNHYPVYIATFAAGICGASSSYQTIMDQMYTETVNKTDNPPLYFGNTLRCLALFMMTGNFWKPGAVVTCTNPPTTANAGPDQNICGTTATLAGNSPSSGTGAWSVVSGTATITSTSSATSTVTGLSSSGSVTLRWTISNGNCTPSTDDVIITSTAAPTTANAGSDQNLCGTTSATLAGNNPSTGKGTWSVVSGTASISNTGTSNTGISGLSANGTVTLRWTITNGSCPASTDDVIIKTSSTPTTANAGSDQNICGSTTATLAGNNPSTGTGTWTVTGGTATISNASSYNTTITGLAATGSVTLRWTISNGTCTASTDDVIIKTSAAPTTANAGPDQSICGSTSATLAGNSPSVGTGTWTVVSGTANISNASSSNTSINGLAANGSVTLRWTISNGTCTASTDDVVVTTSASPTTANAGPDQNLCGTTSATLAANTPSAGTGAWTIVSGSGTLSSTSSPTASVNGLASNGATTLRWTISNGSCTATTDDVVISTSAAPTTANAGTDQNLCNAASATLAGNTPTVGTGTWTIVSGNGTLADASVNNTTVSLPANGAITLRWSVTNGTCKASTDDVVIINAATPTTAAAGPDQNLCGTTTASLAGNAPTSGTGTWTVVGGTATLSNANSATASVTGLTYGSAATLRWTISNGSCAASSDDIVITTSATPSAANAGADQNICGSTSANLTANTPSVGQGAWSVTGGTGFVSNGSSPTTTITGLVPNGTVTIRWSVTNGSCAPATDDVVITTTAAPSTANAGPDQTLCGAANVTLAGNTPSSGTGAWTVVSGTATVTTPSNPTSGVTGLVANSTVTLRWTISNGTCTPSSDDVVITTTAGVAANAGPDQNLCGTASATLAGNNPAPSTGTWSLVNGTATITTPSSPSSTVTGLPSNGAVTLRWTITGGVCGTSTDDVIITNSSMPSAVSAGPDQNLCSATTVTLTATAPVSGKGSWSIASGQGTVTNNANGTGTLTGLPANGAVTVRLTISNGACPSYTDDMVINNAAAPTANAGTDQTLCNATSTTLSATLPASGTGVWSVVSGTANIASNSNPLSTVTGLSANGAVTLRWTVSNGACTPATDDLIITTGATPTAAAAGSDQSICNTNTTLAGNTPAVGTGTWTVVSGSASFEQANNPTTAVSGLGNGANTLRWTISNSSCTASSDDVVITVSGAPTQANAGPDQYITNGSTASLAANVPSVGTGKWTVTGGTATIADPNAASTSVNLGNGANTLRWTISNGSCVSYDEVVISVGSAPTTSMISGPVTVTSPQSNVTYSVTLNEGSTYDWTVTGDVTIVSTNDNEVIVNIGSGGGTISVTETNSFGQGTPVSLSVSVSTAVQSAYAIGTVEVHPNPFEEESVIRFNTTATAPITLRIMDVSGKEMMTMENQFANDEIRVGKELPQGVYMIHATQDNKMQIIRLIKVK